MQYIYKSTHNNFKIVFTYLKVTIFMQQNYKNSKLYIKVLNSLLQKKYVGYGGVLQVLYLAHRL